MNPLLISLNVKDTEDVQLDKALSGYLKSCYGSSQWKNFYDKQLSTKLDTLRTTSNSELAEDTLIALNYKYVAILEQLSLRSGNNSNILNVEFTWFEANYNNSAKNKYSQKSLAIEKSSTIYNIGALLSKSAKDTITGTTQDYKSAISCLSKSYGCFQYLAENFLNSPSSDIKTTTTKFLSNLCHAQAQELFALKLINSPNPEKQASLLSRLCLSAHKLYLASEEFCKEGSEPSYGGSNWNSIISFKSLFYKCLSLFYHAISLENASKIGESIAFLELSKNVLYEALPLKVFVKEMDVEYFQGLIEKRLSNAIKDNDFIYHDVIPKEVSPETIKPMDAIKPVHYMKQQLMPYMTEVSGDCNLLFKGIVPMEVYEKESIYSEKKSHRLREDTDVAQTADWEYESFIEFTNLSKLLPDLESKYQGSGSASSADPESEYVNDQVTRWSAQVARSPYCDISSEQKKLLKTRQEILDLLNNVNDKDSSVKLKASLVQASQSDENLFSLVSPYMGEIQLLRNASVLKRTFNSFKTNNEEVDLLGIDDSKNEQILTEIHGCKETFEHLKLLKRERARLLGELKQKVNSDDSDEGLLQLVLENQQSKNLDALFDELITKHFGELSSRIEATIFQQKNMITEIKVQLDKIFKLSGVQKASAEAQDKIDKRDELFSRIEKAYNVFKIFANDLPKGIEFYNSLLSMVKSLEQPQSSHGLNEQFRNLAVDNNAPPLPQAPQGMNNFYPQQNQAPLIPQRPSAMNNSPEFGMPQLPPKPGSFSTGSNQQGQNFKEKPTSFYNNPSVFDESLYNSYK